MVRPYGKWAWYVTDGNNELAVQAPEAIYSGEQDIKEPYKIRVLKCLKHSIKTPIKDYKTNVHPTNLQSQKAGGGIFTCCGCGGKVEKIHIEIV